MSARPHRSLLVMFSLAFVACGGKAQYNDAPENSVGGSSTTGGTANTGGIVGSGGSGASGGSHSDGGGGPTPACTDNPPAASACRLALAGVNLASAEFGSAIPGTIDKDYTYPGAADVSYFASKGMTVIRLPFRWERLQRDLGGELDPEELGRIQGVVALAKAQGMVTILDPHNYARYQLAGEERLIGDGTLTVEHFASFWLELAAHFKDEPSVVFGLMNEPHDIPSDAWLNAANAAIEAIRNTGAQQLVLVPGNHWTGAHSWMSSDNWATMLGVVDPSNNFAYEVHQYLDANHSGGSEACTVLDGESVLGDFTNWLRQHGARGFLGEFGGGTSEDCKWGITSVLVHMENNADVWMGWTYWAGGPWWGDYFSSIAPNADGSDKPQMEWLSEHVP